MVSTESYVTRELQANYKPSEATIAACVQDALSRVPAVYLAYDITKDLDGSDGSLNVRIKVRHAVEGTDDWMQEYAGDPAGRCSVHIHLAGYRVRYHVHAKGIYKSEPQRANVGFYDINIMSQR